MSTDEVFIKNSGVKSIEIVAGPNGSGKTTFASVYLLRSQSRAVYLNPDRIASGIAPLDFEKASFHAGRVLLSEIKIMMNADESFAFESTLSGRSWLRVLKAANDQNYEITLYFLYLDSIKKSLQRIKKRVFLGGHPIPTDSVYRRYPKCFKNFWELYRPLCKEWYIFDNSGTKPQLLQSKKDFEALNTQEQDKFAESFLKGEKFWAKKKIA